MHRFAKTLAVAALAVAPAFAVVTPTAPGPGVTCNAGSPCTAEWDLDTTGQWADTTIDLMTGSNFQMVKLQTLTTVDGTKSPNTFTFTTPEVEPYATIYFLQWSRQGGLDPQWATRFTIADASGNSVRAPNATQPDGAAIPWGIGRLLGASGNATTSSVVSSSAASSSTASSSAASSSVASSSVAESTTVSTTTVPRASQSASTTGTGAAGKVAVSVFGLGAVAAVMALVA